MTWKLDDAGAWAAQNPYTYYKASDETIALVKVGEYVKLSFGIADGPGGERMWVTVEEIGPGDRFVGALANSPQHISDLFVGQRVEFQRCHIVNTEHDPAGHWVDRLMVRCFVTQRVLDGEEAIGHLYREAPMNDEDSGWRISAGTESDEYMHAPGNVKFVSLGVVMNQDDSVLSLLGEPAGVELRRDPETKAFRQVP